MLIYLGSASWQLNWGRQAWRLLPSVSTVSLTCYHINRIRDIIRAADLDDVLGFSRKLKAYFRKLKLRRCARLRGFAIPHLR